MAWVFRGLRLYHDLWTYLHCTATQAKAARRAVDDASGGCHSGGYFDGDGPGGNSLSGSRSTLLLVALSLLCLESHYPGLLFPPPAQGQRRGQCAQRILLTAT